jgi:hypothetical protein
MFINPPNPKALITRATLAINTALNLISITVLNVITITV